MKIKQHDIETSLLEGMLTRGDRRVAAGAGRGLAARRRLDGWTECFKPELWWQTFARPGHRRRLLLARASGRSTEVLPWDHVNVKKGRAYLEKEQERSVIQLQRDGRRGERRGRGRRAMGAGAAGDYSFLASIRPASSTVAARPSHTSASASSP